MKKRRQSWRMVNSQTRMSKIPWNSRNSVKMSRKQLLKIKRQIKRISQREQKQ